MKTGKPSRQKFVMFFGDPPGFPYMPGTNIDLTFASELEDGCGAMRPTYFFSFEKDCI